MRSYRELVSWYMARHVVELDAELSAELARRLTVVKAGAPSLAWVSPRTLVEKLMWGWGNSTGFNSVDVEDAVDSTLRSLVSCDRRSVETLSKRNVGRDEASLTRNLGFSGDVELGLITVDRWSFIVGNVRSLERAATIVVLYLNDNNELFSLYVPTVGNGFVDGQPAFSLVEPVVNARELLLDLADHVNVL